MRQIETTYRPVAAPPRAESRFSASRRQPPTEFLSQLIAERHRLATQRARRRAALDEVLQTYDTGGRITVRRMPPGYRLDIEI